MSGSMYTQYAYTSLIVFVELPAFDRHRAEYLDDDSFRALQNYLVTNPTAGLPIPDTGGLRKVRFGDTVLALHPFRQGRNGRPEATTTQRPEGDDQGRAGSKEDRMRKPIKKVSAGKKKRDLFGELTEGFNALADARAGKRTLRTHSVELQSAPEVTAQDLIRLREERDLSRGLFARYLRTNVRTLENWKQGRAKPNAQAALLISLVKRYPDTIDRIASI